MKARSDVGSVKDEGLPEVKHFGGGLLTVLLWAGLVGAGSLIGVRWVDSSVGIVAVLQSIGPLAGAVLVVVVVVIAAITRRWRITVAAGALLAVCAPIGVPSLVGHTATPGRDDLVPQDRRCRAACHSLTATGDLGSD
ncbi:MAG: hypothetical protein ABI903_14655 [Actinomycetota bacterium]